jgi:molybdopterin molybdotransferase
VLLATLTIIVFDMTISYTTALSLIETTCNTIALTEEETIILQDAVGRIAARDITSPISSPALDTSAMDGYAIRSAATLHASPEHPVSFRIKGMIAAGKGLQLFSDVERNSPDGDLAVEPCLEIMTGARFPTVGPYEELDACVRVEDVGTFPESVVDLCRQPKINGLKHPTRFANTSRTICITRRIPPNSNRRPAGADLQQGDILVKVGQCISATRIMPLASVGIRQIPVRRKPRVGVWSTGAEILGDDAEQAADVNGPFLVAALREAGCEAVFLGVLEDDVESMSRSLSMQGTIAGSSIFDLLITSGGVSVGKFDCVRAALESLDAEIVFHGVNIRPGHPVLFGTIPGREGASKLPFFGLPGNPGAAAACFRFLVMPLLCRLLGRNEEKRVLARLLAPNTMANGAVTDHTGPHRHTNGRTKSHAHGKTGCGRSQAADCFRPGRLETTADGTSTVLDLGRGKDPSMLSPFTQANCWIHLPPTLDGEGEERGVACYPLQAQSIWE